MDLKELRSRLTGAITTTDDSHYERLRRSMVWNQLAPDRRPSVIVQAANENAVVEAVKYARANQMQVAVRGAGHSWCGLPLRDGSLLVDLGRLKSAAIDSKARIATVGPGLTGGELNRRLDAQGLAFPVPHGPSVPMSGFLLSGGFGWNSNAWGPACFSIESARVVTADGNLVVANEKENADMFWALRGAGPGFFGIVTEYTLRLFSAPRIIATSNYHYPLSCAGEVAAWAAGVAFDLPKEVELSLVIAAAPTALIEPSHSGSNFICTVIAVAFMEEAGPAGAALAVLDECPVAGECLASQSNVPISIDALHDQNSISLPASHRYAADAVWTNSPVARVVAASCEQFVETPSAKSHELVVLATGASRPALPDAAFSMAGNTFVDCVAIWQDPEDDEANLRWHRRAITALEKYSIGRYIGESDIITDPSRSERCFAKPNWERLKRLREKYDPDGRFPGF